MEEPCGQRLVVAQSPAKSGRCLDDPAYALVARRVAALERGLLAQLQERGLIPTPSPPGSGGKVSEGSGQAEKGAEEDVSHLGPIEDEMSQSRGQCEGKLQEKEKGQEKGQEEGPANGEVQGQEEGQGQGQGQGQGEGQVKGQGDHLQELTGSAGTPVGSPEKPAKELPEKLPGPEGHLDHPADGQAEKAGAGQDGSSPEGGSHKSHHSKPGQLLHHLIDKFQQHRVKSEGQPGKTQGQSPGQSRRHSETGQVAGKDGEHGSRGSQEGAPGQADGQVHGQLKKVPSKGHLKWHAKAGSEEAPGAQKQSQSQNRSPSRSPSPNHHSFAFWHHPSAPPAPGSLLGTPRLEELYSLQQALGNGHLGAVNVCRCRATRKLYACKTIHKGELKNARNVEEVKMEILGMAQMQLRGGAGAGTGTGTDAGTDASLGTGTGAAKGTDTNGTSDLSSGPASNSGSATGARASASAGGEDGLQYVVRLYEVFDDADAIHLITDYCEAGDLLHYVVARGRLPEKECATMVMQLARGLAAMHRVGLIHRDIKPENILLTRKERPHDKGGEAAHPRSLGLAAHLPHLLHHPAPHPPAAEQDSSSPGDGASSHIASIMQASHPHTLGLGLGHGHTQGGHQSQQAGGGQQHKGAVTFRVGDFGSCVQMRAAGEPARGLVGSPKYMAPEVIRGEGYDAGVDVWSLGVVLYACLAGRQPFVGAEVGEVFACVCDSDPDLARPHWAQVSPEAKSLVTAMLQKDPLQRISVQGVLLHPWVQRHCGGQVPVSKPAAGHAMGSAKAAPIPLQC